MPLSAQFTGTIVTIARQALHAPAGEKQLCRTDRSPHAKKGCTDCLDDNTQRMKQFCMLTLIPAMIALAGCTREAGMIRYTRPVERLDVEVRTDGSGLVRTAFADISMRIVSAPEWIALGKTGVFYTKVDEEQRMPPFTCLLIGIRNISPMPVSLHSLNIVTANETFSSWQAQEVAGYFFGPCYSRPDLNTVFLPRRILTDTLPLFGEIDFDRTLLCDFPAVMPGDTVLMFRALPWIPAEERRFTVSAEFMIGTLKKTVAIDMQRFEYRRKGDYFNEPEQPGKNNDGY
jgi:hypothetical protein